MVPYNIPQKHLINDHLPNFVYYLNIFTLYEMATNIFCSFPTT